MSGPKVVRIVTREEILSICEGHLRRLDQAIDMWVRDGKRIGELNDDEIAATLERRKTLGTLLVQDAFTDLQKKVPEEIAFLNADLERRQNIAIDKAAQVRKRQRQGRDSAAALIQALESRSVTIPLELHEKLRSLASGNAMNDADAILAKGFILMIPQAPAGLTDAQRNLADRLMVGVETQDFATWKSTYMAKAPNTRIEHIDRQLAEFQALLEPDQLADFAMRLGTIEALEANTQQNLLLDSLILDLGSVLKSAREHRSAIAELAMLAADLREGDLSAETTRLLQGVATCNFSTPLKVINEFVIECKALIIEAQQRREADARRKAILQGLAQLGYEVSEGMETAWARDGQIIAKKPSLPDYGVEIGGQAHTGRLQVRTVALTADRDANRDKDIETIWCGEFSKLQDLLAEHGDNLVIERALGIGAVPLKVVSNTQSTNVDPHARTFK
jgi:hypothetical protein